MNLSSRRNFLRNVGGLATAASLVPLSNFASVVSPVLPNVGHSPLNEKYWQLVKDQFTVNPGYIMMNAANLCPAPRAVIEAVANEMEKLDHDVSFQYRSVYDEQLTEAKQGMAEYLGATTDELIITRNTSESNNTIVNGLDFGKGDEVVLWEQNHPTNLKAWQERARRMGFTVKVISLPQNFASRDKLIEVFTDAFTSKTRLVAFSHISNVSGLRLPAKELVREAKNRGILTHIDGAQSFGCIQVDLKDLGCDFYSGSSHKWFMGPRETGILYVKKVHIERLWPNIISAGYGSFEPGDIQRLANYGQRNNAVLAGLLKTLEFHNRIGPDIIELRSLEIAFALRQKITDRIPQVEWVTPENQEFRSSVMICNIPGKDNRELFTELYEKHHIAAAPTGGLRFCPHIYNTMEDIDHVVEALAIAAS